MSYYGLVGRSLDYATVKCDPGGDVFRARYYTRSQVLLTRTDIIEHYSVMPPRLLKRSMEIQAELMQRFADQADDYAQRNFSPEVLYSYYRSMLT